MFHSNLTKRESSFSSDCDTILYITICIYELVFVYTSSFAIQFRIFEKDLLGQKGFVVHLALQYVYVSQKKQKNVKYNMSLSANPSMIMFRY